LGDIADGTHTGSINQSLIIWGENSYSYAQVMLKDAHGDINIYICPLHNTLDQSAFQPGHLFGTGFEMYFAFEVEKDIQDVINLCHRNCKEDKKSSGFGYSIKDRYDRRPNGNCWFMTGEVKYKCSEGGTNPGGVWIKADQARIGVFKQIIAPYSSDVTIDGTPQKDALVWLADVDPLQLALNTDISQLLARFSLAVLYETTNEYGWNDQLNSWISRAPTCACTSVTCSVSGVIVKLVLSKWNAEISLLTFL
jgi:hypothetical protein